MSIVNIIQILKKANFEFDGLSHLMVFVWDSDGQNTHIPETKCT